MKKIKRLNGPYIHGPNSKLAGRAYYNIYYEDGSRTTMLRSRYMMEQHLGRKLKTSEHVDHINGDKTDDRLENLQVLTIADHTRKTIKDSGRVIEYVTITCALCGSEAQKEARNVRHNAKRNKTGPYCSRSCAGKASHMPS